MVLYYTVLYLEGNTALSLPAVGVQGHTPLPSLTGEVLSQPGGR